MATSTSSNDEAKVQRNIFDWLVGDGSRLQTHKAVEEEQRRQRSNDWCYRTDVIMFLPSEKYVRSTGKEMLRNAERVRSLILDNHGPREENSVCRLRCQWFA